MNELRKDAEAIFRAALEAVDPYRCVRSSLEGMDLRGRTFVVGMGKAPSRWLRPRRTSWATV